MGFLKLKLHLTKIISPLDSVYNGTKIIIYSKATIILEHMTIMYFILICTSL